MWKSRDVGQVPSKCLQLSPWPWGWIPSRLLLSWNFQSISKLITSPNRKSLIPECKRGKRAHRWQWEYCCSATHGIIMMCSSIRRLKQRPRDHAYTSEARSQSVLSHKIECRVIKTLFIVKVSVDPLFEIRWSSYDDQFSKTLPVHQGHLCILFQMIHHWSVRRSRSLTLTCGDQGHKIYHRCHEDRLLCYLIWILISISYVFNQSWNEAVIIWTPWSVNNQYVWKMRAT